ncbi:F-box/LRR-repeat protein 17-like [Hibiscus syriacus]|uniref:F-box/LRR-repeat protein 17-like n=1 Tax=Hibiscus syriacus TaxID=106335 RepID=UPI001920C17D|nr:F-box/LRR-repeat protein 17-like [Hibiscus syriacus]
MHCPQPHITSSSTTAASVAFDLKPAKRRGSYNCGRCGLPKKGHVCEVSPCNTTTLTSTPTSTPAAATNTETSSSAARPPHPHSARQPYSHLRRALDFDDVDIRCDTTQHDLDGYDNPFPGRDPDPDSEIVSGGLPVGCLWEILRRLPPVGLLAAGSVCKGWRETTKRLWRAVEELRLLVRPEAQLRFIGSVLQKCPGLINLSLKVESDVDATMLACIAFSCPNLESMEISTSDAAVNRITGDELGRFVADKRCLVSLKMEGCSNLGSFVLSSSSLSTLWLSDLYSLSKTVLNCPNLKEISLEFSRQENDSTDLITLVDAMGSCPRLQNIHIASVRLSHAVVLSLTAANLRGLRMLSLVLGSEITDASVAAIASSYSKLELLDLSGSSITDSGIGMICNVFPNTLSRLLLALCPNITSSGIQFAAAQLPLLELMDCGMTICDIDSQNSPGNDEPPNVLNSKLHLMYQKLIIKHSRLKKLSLWGCSGLDALCLSCPELNDLNLNSCKNLHPEKLLLQCPSLRNVHASGCNESLIGCIKSQLSESLASVENHIPRKRMADGSKRIQAPNCGSQQV